MSTNDLLDTLRKQSPHERYAQSTSGFVIGVFDKKLERFVIVWAKDLDNEWRFIEKEILVNGLPPVVDWIE